MSEGAAIVYLLFLLLCFGIAWYFSGFPGVRRLDDRALGWLRRHRRRAG
jgi:hypothetical protein